MSPDTNSILLVDDDSEALLSLARALKAAGLAASVHAAGNPATARDLFIQKRPNVVVLDLALVPAHGVESGFELLKEFSAVDGSARIIMLTGHNAIEHGIRALNLGAASFLEKPADIPLMIALIRDGIHQAEIRRAYEKLKQKRSDVLEDLVVGTSAVIDEVRKNIRYAAANNQAVLITGETGSGKGLCAVAIHRLSARAARHFVRYQSTYSTADLVNSELFGHTKGAFTGALGDRRGLLSDADGGTLLLDELDELPQETQVTLLGVLQERKFRPVGANAEVSSDFRLICATNADPQKSIESGKLRRDLFHRVAHLIIHLPALRERRQDIAPLSAHVLRRLSEREAVAVYEFDPDAVAKLEAYDWGGNVRELEAVVEGAAFRAQYGGRRVIAPNDVVFVGAAPLNPAHKKSFSEQVEDYKHALIEAALQRHAGNQVKAAQELGIDRSSMRRILARAASDD